MSTKQIQFALCKLVNYLNQKQGKVKNLCDEDKKVKNVKNNKNNENDKNDEDDENSEQEFNLKQKQYFDKQIQRVEQVFIRKLGLLQKLENRIGGMSDQIEKINREILELKKMSFQKNEVLLKNIQGNEKAISVLSVTFQEQMKIMNSEMRGKVEFLEKDYLLQQKMMFQFYQKQQKWLKNFFIFGKTVTKISGNKTWNQLTLFKGVSDGNEQKCRIKVLKLFSKKMVFGFLDYDAQKDQMRSFNSNNALGYSSDGMKTPCKLKEGGGFKEGDNIEMRVDRKEKKIIWFVNDLFQAMYCHDMLGEQNRRLMPYVEMYEIGDRIQVNK